MPDPTKGGFNGIAISQRPVPESMKGRPERQIPDGAAPESLLFLLGSVLHESAQRRKHKRVLAPIRVQYHAVPTISDPFPTIVHSVLVNLSLGGAFIRSLNPPDTDGLLELEIPFGDVDIVVRGRVLYHLRVDLEHGIVYTPQNPDRPIPSHPGFAIQFEAFDESARLALKQLLDFLEDAQLG